MSLAVVLHAAMLDGSLAVWAEELGFATRARNAYGLDARKLRSLLVDTFGAAVASEPRLASALAWLPTRGGSPIPPLRVFVENQLHDGRRLEQARAGTQNLLTNLRSGSAASPVIVLGPSAARHRAASAWVRPARTGPRSTPSRLHV